MKKNKQTTAKKKATHKRGLKRSNRLKSTQKVKHLRKKELEILKKTAEQKFEKQMKDLFGQQ